MLKAFNLKNLFKNQFSLALNLKKINKMDSKNVMTDTSTANLNENKTKIDNEIEDVANKKIKLDNSEQAAVENNEPNNESKRPGIKKRKYALLVGYCGEGYFGLQRNSSIKNNQFRTIEDELVDGLVKLNAIPQQHADEMFKMSFQRAARTDKGVSAAENLISLKMELADDTIVKLNEILPKQIKCFGYNKVTQHFDAKNNCDGRTYTYLLPTFAFCPIEENLTESYRATDEIIEIVNKTLALFTGTHNFHNFTSGRKYTDPSSNRYIISFECSKPFLKEGYEFAVIKIRGQSFMLHQIRKMIGLVIAVVRGYASAETIQSCYTAYKIDVPTAPALGLMLDKLHYEKYNRKYGKDGIHKPLEWTEFENEIESFKHEHIFSNMVKKEIKNKSMFNWLSRLPISHFGCLDPSFMRGFYTGVGRAFYLLEKINDNKVYREDEEEESGAGDD